MMAWGFYLVFTLAAVFPAGAWGHLYGSIALACDPVSLYVDGHPVLLPNSKIQYKPDRVYLGNPAKDDCVTVAIQFTHCLNNQNWIKASFSNGDETGASWRCTDNAPVGWNAPSFDDSKWEVPKGHSFGYNHWYWEGDKSFLAAPMIWYKNKEKATGNRYCRAKICNKCKESQCYTCERDNPCDPLKTPGQCRYPHFEPNKYVYCTNGTCVEASDGEKIHGYFSAFRGPVTAYLNGKQVPLMYSNTWDTSDKLNLGIVPKGQCVTVAIAYQNYNRNGWIKGYFSNGEQTDHTWKCSDSAPVGWQQPVFIDANWVNAFKDGSKSFWRWNPTADPFKHAPLIRHDVKGANGPRFCRKKICNK